jgi:hypothetical protein
MTTHPFRDAPDGLPWLIQRLASAATVEEWNETVAWIVMRLAALSAPGGRMDGDDARFFRSLKASIAAGFRARPSKPASVHRALDDAALILGESHGLPACRTLRDAAERLAIARRVTAEAARKRVIRAETVAGFRLPRSPRFGEGPTAPRGRNGKKPALLA